MKEFFSQNPKIASSGLIIALVLALIIPLGVVFGAGSALFGAAVGVGSALKEAPANCKAPPNLFDAWETLRDFITGVDCAESCALENGMSGPTTAEKAEYVKKIIGVGNKMGVSEKGQIVAITTTLVESNLQNYANDGIYDTSRNPSDATLAEPAAILGFIKKSLDYPHDAVGSDASSVGLFQQQAWWGTVGNSNWKTDPDNTMKRLMDPVFGSQKFYERMLSIRNWEQMDYGVVAQKVQVSAFPDAYGQRVNQAKGLYAQYKNEPADVTLHDLGQEYDVSGPGNDGTECGNLALPLDKNSLYQVTSQWAQEPRALRDGYAHNGVDFDCNDNFENIYSPVDGVVLLVVEGNSSGFGKPAGNIEIKSADGTKFEFHHNRKAFVSPGQSVTAGTPIGECASTGNSNGTHLHLEADVSESTNPALKALPDAVDQKLKPGLRDPVLVLEVMGIDICPPYAAERKTVTPGTPLPTRFVKCWPPEEWVR